jgi:hypothetical protein
MGPKPGSNLEEEGWRVSQAQPAALSWVLNTVPPAFPQPSLKEFCRGKGHTALGPVRSCDLGRFLHLSELLSPPYS